MWNGLHFTLHGDDAWDSLRAGDEAWICLWKGMKIMCPDIWTYDDPRVCNVHRTEVETHWGYSDEIVTEVMLGDEVYKIGPGDTLYRSQESAWREMAKAWREDSCWSLRQAEMCERRARGETE